MRAILLALALAGCTTSDVDTAPDAAVTVDAATCEPTLQRCAFYGCGVGARPLDCPRSEDTSVCYCAAPVGAVGGWCLNQ